MVELLIVLVGNKKAAMNNQNRHKEDYQYAEKYILYFMFYVCVSNDFFM